jgi:hypothetical protein
MAVKVKHSDPSAQQDGRSITWDSSAGDFVNGDVLDIYSSLSRPAQVTIEVAAAGSCTVRINSLNRRYPIHPDGKLLKLPFKDLTVETVWLNATAPEFSFNSGETHTFDVSVNSVEFTALSGNAVVIAR